MTEMQTRGDAAYGAFAPAPAGIAPAEAGAIALGALWLLAGLLVLVLGAEGVSFVALVAAVMPAATFWLAAYALRTARLLRQESQRLQAAIDALRHSGAADRTGRAATRPPARAPSAPLTASPAAAAAPAPAPSPSAPQSAAPRPAAPQPAARQPAAPRPPPEEQPSLALGPPAEDGDPPLSRADFLLALHFPDDERDEAGFAALRRSLKDRKARQLIQASQDVLTLLSQDGIYMDDLVPDRARPEVWRRFARGERGRSVADLGGVRDRTCLAQAGVRMREDTIFRDAAHHFLRLFDRMLAEFEPEATDEEIAILAETRTARAFMLLGRVTGIFD